VGANGCAANPEEKIKMKQLVKNLLNDESGQDLIEYALIAALIALAAVGAMQTVGSKIGNTFNSVGSDI
jgi:pilus assembly protein Flp/PilA